MPWLWIPAWFAEICATAGDDFATFATVGLNASCADLIEEIKVIEADTETCLNWFFGDVRSTCCPGTPLEDPIPASFARAGSLPVMTLRPMQNTTGIQRHVDN